LARGIGQLGWLNGEKLRKPGTGRVLHWSERILDRDGVATAARCMCGIAGIVSPDVGEVSPAVQRMTQSLVHRGPDDAGIETFSVGGAAAGFGFRRLAILDLTPAGHQPMLHPATGDCLVFNGEIYNFRQLRAELVARGSVFRGHGDTEVLLEALVTWGAEALPRLEGMYALAFHDKRADRILLARDPLGIKPLYVAESAGRLVFASEVRAVLASGIVPVEWDPAGVATLLAYGAPQDPFTLLRAIRSFPAGGCEWIRAPGGRVQREGPRRFWRFPRGGNKADDGNVPSRVRSLVDAAVRDHLASDVPIGVFLSAGIDSTIVAALAARHAGAIRTFSVGFTEEGVADELQQAAATARGIGSVHEEIVLAADEIPALWDAWLSASDRPSIDGFNSFVISRAVKQAGLTVALSGLGGDEIFGGYGSFGAVGRYHRVASAMRFMPRRMRRGIARLATLGRPASVREKLPDLLGGEATVESVALQMRRVLSDRQVEALGLTAARVGLTSHWLTADVVADLAGPAADVFTAVSRIEACTYMANTLLRDTDVNSMAVSLEIRVPLLAQQLVDYVAPLSSGIKAPVGGGTKWLLRESCRDLIPTELLSRPKTGFTLPIERWMRGAVRERCEAALAVAAESGLVPAEEVSRMWREFVTGTSGIRWTRPMTLVALGNAVESLRRATGRPMTGSQA
jgi:asparagine synthase (glutamine-hydrolysing)